VATIKLQNGNVVLQDGKVSCECCDIDINADYAFANPEDCDCETAVCYSSTNPPPYELNIAGTVYENRAPIINGAQQRFQVGRQIGRYIDGGSLFAITGGTGPYRLPNGANTYSGWVNVVSSPAVVRITGNIGGDMEIWHVRFDNTINGIVPYEYPLNWENNFELRGVVPDEGEYPCGVCSTPRNGPRPVDYSFVLWPFTWFSINLISYLECAPWAQLRLQRVGPYTPP